MLDIIGTITDESGPLAGVIVQAKSDEGKTLGYCMSDKAGKFSLSASSPVSSISFSLMGYTKEELKAPFKSPITVVMKESKEKLKASTVLSSVATVKHDTIRYTAAAVSQKEDKVLGDMLKRLPGIQVSEEGRVTYNGIGINRLYVEGKNILDNDYHLATKNLDIKAIKAVNIYENHQPIKVLRNIVETRSAALDIELEDNAKDSWLLNATVQGGYMEKADIPYYAKASAMKVGGKSSSVLVGDADATGHTNDQIRKSEYSSASDIDDYYDVSPLISTSLDVIDLDKSLSIINHSASFQTKEKYSIGEGTVLGVSAKLSKDNASTFMQTSTKYTFPDMELTQDIDRSNLSKEISASVSIESNKNKGYVRDEVEFLTNVDDGLSSMSGEMDLDEDNGLKKIDISNTLNFAVASKKGASLKGHLYSQYTQDSGNYTSTYDNLSQDYSRKIWWNRASLNGATKKFGDFRISLTPSATLYHGSMLSENFGDIPEDFPKDRANDIAVTNINPELAAGLIFQRHRFNSTMTGKMAYRTFDISQGGRHSFTSFASPSFIWFSEYKTPYITTSVMANLKDDVTSNDRLGDGMIITGYNTLRKGRDIPIRLPSILASCSINYSNPMTGLYSGLAINASKKSILTLDRSISGNYILTADLEDISSINTVGATLSASKGIFALEGKIDASVGYSSYWSMMYQNGIAYDYTGGSLTASAEWTLCPLNWLVLNNKTFFSANTISVEGVSGSSKNRKIKENFEIVFRLSKKTSLNTSIDYFRNSSEQTSQLLLANVASVWMLNNGMNIFLRCSNLFNNQDYTYTTYGPLMESVVSYRIRPLSVMIGMTLTLSTSHSQSPSSTR